MSLTYDVSVYDTHMCVYPNPHIQFPDGMTDGGHLAMVKEEPFQFHKGKKTFDSEQVVVDGSHVAHDRADSVRQRNAGIPTYPLAFPR